MPINTSRASELSLNERERRVRIVPSYHCKKWSGNEPTLPRLALAEHLLWEELIVWPSKWTTVLKLPTPGERSDHNRLAQVMCNIGENRLSTINQDPKKKKKKKQASAAWQKPIVYRTGNLDATCNAVEI